MLCMPWVGFLGAGLNVYAWRIIFCPSSNCVIGQGRNSSGYFNGINSSCADWRVANVTPIFKKGNRSLPCNYRPVSLTSVVCKVMESVVKDCMLKYLLDNGLLLLSQHGFLPNRSCVTNLLSFLEDVSLSLDFGHSVDVI